MLSNHTFAPVILREYDIRGTVGKNLHVADAAALGRAFGTKVLRAGGMKIAVGYDGRTHSPELEAALVDGLKSTGAEVVRIGLGPTPMLYFSTYHLNADAGIMVTGSHNPPDQNGFKMLLAKRLPGGGPVYGEAIQGLAKLAAAGDFVTGSGSISTVDISEAYIERLLKDFCPAPPLTPTSFPTEWGEKELLSTARDMISCRKNLIEGVRQICSLSHSINDPDNSVFNLLVGVESETDHFPLGKERDNWNAESLNRLDVEMEEYISDIKDDVLQSCNEIIRLYNSEGRWVGVRGDSSRPLKVVWDNGNGAAGDIVQRLVKRLPGEHILLFPEIDGRFPNHHPDPTVAENLRDLQDAVAKHKADLGVAFDGDADRIGAVDGRGRILAGDQLLAIYAAEVLKTHKGATIIADVKASKTLFDSVAANGGVPLMWKTGHSLIKVKMAETNSPLAGEMSGHIFFADKFYGFDDAVYCAVRLISLVSASGKSLAAWRDTLPDTVNTPELRFEVDESRKFGIVAEIKARLLAEGANVNDTDGVRVNTPDGWWLLRASNTQAVLVARAESSDAAGLGRLKSQLAAHLQACGVELPEF